MGVRAIKVRIECDRETLLALWRTHRVFNERLPSLITKLFAMGRGELGDTADQQALYQQIARFVLARDSKDAPYLLNSVSIKRWQPKTAQKMKTKARDVAGVEQEVTGDTWATEAAELSAKGALAYNKEAERDGLPDSIFQPLIRDAVAYISGHDALVKNWHTEHETWLKKRKEWEAKEEHKKYLALRPRFDEFEKTVGGKAGKRRGRWHLYLKWLRDNPDLAAWRGSEADVHPLGDKAQARIEKARPWKKRSVEADEFWKVNPELAALDRLHGFYEREFIRRRKTKKNPDGFDHRPTFTMPDPVLHPRWALFNAPQTSPEGYNNLNLPDGSGDGSVSLRLLTEGHDEDGWPNEWITVRFRSDPRLARFFTRTEMKTITKGKRKGKTKATQTFRFIDNQLGEIERKAQISGAKLIFKFKNVRRLHQLVRHGTPDEVAAALPHLVVPYLVFACTIEDEALSPKAKKIKWSETGEVTKSGKKRKTKKLPDGLVSCAVDLGIRNLGFITLATLGKDHGIQVLRSHNLRLGQIKKRNDRDCWSPGPDLAHISDHKREIKRLRRLRGKPIKGEQSHVKLQDHITHMSQDRFKKAARAIVNFALNVDGRARSRTGKAYPRADVLILEQLEGLIPDAERERGINRALVKWNRGQLVERIREVAKDAGLKVFEVYPVGTSQCCSKCGAFGRRYSTARDDDTHDPIIRFGWVEKLFACPNPKCTGRDAKRPDRPFTCNADHNASVNLHRQFVFPDQMGKPAEVYKQEWTDRTKAERDQIIQQIERSLRTQLERLHGFPLTEIETPF